MYKKIVLALLCFFELSLVGAEDDSYWDTYLVSPYVHNSELQRRWAWAFLAPHMRELKGDEHILDVGCGDGKITADLSMFVPRGSVIGIDPSRAMLAWAKKQYSPLDYPNLIFYEGGFLEPNVSGPFDVIVSNCAFQHCEDQLLAFENAFGLLKPGGKLLISIPAIDNPAWKEAWSNMEVLPKWASYWEDSRPIHFLSVEGYIELLKNAKFHPLRVEKIQTRDPFIDREEFLTFLIGTMTPAVPLELVRDFFNELTDEYLRLLPEALKPDGVVEARFGRIVIEAMRLD